jgi:hypothetical protein
MPKIGVYESLKNTEKGLTPEEIAEVYVFPGMKD